MAKCLETQKSDCKNCYKCIRHCPVKSIRFTDGQAHIIRDECVLCGECYVVCPQNAKQIRNDTQMARDLIKSRTEVYVSLAPSFAAYYEGKSLKSMAKALKQLGFTDVFETAVGAEIVKKEYERVIASGEQSCIISSCCHSVNSLIERHYKGCIPYLAKVVTPMHAHADYIRSIHPGAGVVFIGPCISKKAEAEKYGCVDCVLTYDELDGWLAQENIAIEAEAEDDVKGRTRIFPTSGGVFGSMDKQEGFHYLLVDGMEKCISALEDLEKGALDNCFIEMSACNGSCITGPIMKKKNRNPLKDLLSVSSVCGEDEYLKDVPEISISQKFSFEGTTKMMPGSAAIEEILRKLGKNTKDKELNCGTCGYNTCREKAVAVLMGKADLTMCLPYLKDKAESFSDTIISNTPNAIIVLDEQMNIQLMNKSAKQILNLPPTTDIIGSPVVRILDPIDFIMAMSGEKNTYDKRVYLAEYQKYVEETIIYDKEFHITMAIMKDVTDEEKIKSQREVQGKAAIEITDKVVEKQMRIVQEIASLLGETTAETKIALTKLKETLADE